MAFLSVFTLLIVNIISSGYCEDIFLETTSGKLKGLQEQVEGKVVNAFLGVPYAEPPVGHLRFRRPQTIQPRGGVIDATRKPPSCYQMIWNLEPDWIEPRHDFSEDCLYLNLWSPVCNKEKCNKKAIMIFFHGGGFAVGSSNVPAYHGAGLSAVGDVIVVVINYRLGVFGFFDANHEDGPDNNGIYDQIEAMKWVKKNAERFGGDPDLITIFGESAGSLSVGMHLISPISRDLFQYAILQSGSIFSPSFVDNPQRALLKGDAVAKLLGCSREESSLRTHPEAVLNCLRGKPAEELTQAEQEIGSAMLFLPVYNSELLPAYPTLAMQRGDIKSTEVLMGLTSQEGGLILSIINRNTFSANGVKNVKNTDLLRFLYELNKVWGIDLKEEDIDSYFESIQKEDARQAVLATADFVGDICMNCPTAYFSDNFTDLRNKLYRYVFVLHGNRSNLVEWSGTTHLDEIPYVFGYTLIAPDQFTDDDRKFSKEIIKVWSTFAKTGAPPKVDGKDWPAYTRDNPVYFELNPDDYGVKSGWRKEQCDRIKYGFQ